MYNAHPAIGKGDLTKYIWFKLNPLIKYFKLLSNVNDK